MSRTLRIALIRGDGIGIDEAGFGGGCVAALIAHVAEAARGRGVLENRAADYLPVIRATEAAYRSAATGARIGL